MCRTGVVPAWIFQLGERGDNLSPVCAYKRDPLGCLQRSLSQNNGYLTMAVSVDLQSLSLGVIPIKVSHLSISYNQLPAEIPGEWGAGCDW